MQPVFGGVSAFDAAWLVVAGGVKGEFADEVAGFSVQDADVEVVDEHDDVGAPGDRMIVDQYFSKT